MIRQLFGRIEPGEGKVVFWSAAYFFCLLGGYFLLRPVREQFGVRGGLEDLPWLFLGTVAAMLLLNPVYAWVVGRVERRRLIPIVYRFFALHLLAFFVAERAATGETQIVVGRVFYVWLSVFNLFAVSIFWQFMNDGFGPGQARRLFGLIGVGGTLGAVIGSFATTRLGDVSELTGLSKDDVVPFLFLGGALGLELAVRASRRVGLLFAADGNAASGRALGGGALEGIREVLASRYLLGICAWLFCYALISSLLYFVQAGIVAAVAPDDGTRTETFGLINFAGQSLTLLLQLFVTGRFLQKVGVGWGLASLPIVTLVGLGALAVAPVLGVLIAVQVVRRGVSLAFANPARHGLFAVVSRSEKYKAKAFVDTFVVRSGDATAASLQLAAKGAAVATGTLFALGAPLMLAWAGLSLWLGREREKRAAEGRDT